MLEAEINGPFLELPWKILMLREHIMEAWLTRFQKEAWILIRNCKRGYLCDSLDNNMALICPYLESRNETEFKDNGLLLWHRKFQDRRVIVI